MVALTPAAQASDFSEPWKNADRALVVDAYEYNSIDWAQIATDKRVVAFINKASDGMLRPAQTGFSPVFIECLPVCLLRAGVRFSPGRFFQPRL